MKVGKCLLFVALVALITSPAAYAVDLSQGTILISGDSNFSLSSRKVEFEGGGDETTTGFGLDLMGGYFVMDNLEVGAIFGFNYEKTKNGTETKTSEFTLGAGANYYFGIGSDVLFPYAGGYLAYASQTTKFDDYYGSSEYTAKGIEFGVRGGAKYFLNEHFAADGGLKLALGKGTYKNGSSMDIDMTEFEIYAGVAVLL